MSRGKKKPSLHTLSREPLTPEDHAALHSELIAGTDRSAALVGCAIVEAALVRALASRLLFKPAPETGKDFEEMFYSVRAPFSTLATRIKLGRAIGIYAWQMQEMLDTVRRIRNVFAHSVRPLSFDHELIADELDALPDAKLSDSKVRALGFESAKVNPHRNRYLAVCLGLAIVLEDHAARHEGKPLTVDVSDGPTRTPKPLPRKPV